MIHLNLKQQLLCFMQHAHYLYVRIPYVFKMGSNIHQSSQQSNSIQYTCRDLFTFFFIFISWKKMTVRCVFVSQTIASLRKDLVPGKALQKRRCARQQISNANLQNTVASYYQQYIQCTYFKIYKTHIRRLQNIHYKIFKHTLQDYRIHIRKLQSIHKRILNIYYQIIKYTSQDIEYTSHDFEHILQNYRIFIIKCRIYITRH